MNGWWLFLVVVLPFLWLWIAAIVEVLRTPTRSMGRRLVWAMALLLVPVVALPAHIVMRTPLTIARPPTSGGSRRAGRLVELAERRQRGELGDDAYRSRVDALFDTADV